MGKAARRKEERRGQTETPALAKASHSTFLFASLIVVAGFVAYHNSFRGTFLFDDLGAILDNPSIRSLWPPWGPLSPPRRVVLTGRPFVNLSLALNYAWGGFDVRSYHVFNVAIHILSGLALFGVVRRTLAAPRVTSELQSEASPIAAAVALLWVVHPLASESVDYTIQRTELLMALFFLLTLDFVFRAFAEEGRWRWQVAALAAFFLGLGSKEVIVAAPLVIFVSDWLFWSGSPRRALVRHWKLYAGFAAAFGLFLAAFDTNLRRALAGVTRRAVSPWEYALTQTGIILHYVRLALWPAPLVGDYEGWPVAKSIGDVLPTFLIIVGLLALTLWGLLRGRKLAFLGVFFFAVLAPTSSFRQILTEIAAERRMYLPLAAVIVLVVLATRTLVRRLELPRATGIVLVALAVAVLARVTIRRNEDYRTTFSFWSDVVRKRPDNPRGRMWLGDYYFRNQRVGEALTQFQEAVRLQPANASNRYNLGNALSRLGRDPEAIEEYREAVKLNPEHARAHYNLARCLVGQGLTIEAIEHFETALRLQPDLTAARRGLEAVRESLQP